MRRLRYWLIRKLGGWTPDSPCIQTFPDSVLHMERCVVGRHGQPLEHGAIVTVTSNAILIGDIEGAPA